MFLLFLNKVLQRWFTCVMTSDVSSNLQRANEKIIEHI